MSLAEAHASSAIKSSNSIMSSPSKEKPPYDLSIFWNIIQDSTLQNDKIKETALNSLVKLLDLLEQDKKTYIKKAAECLKPSDPKNIELNMKLIKKLNPISLFSYRGLNEDAYFEFIEQANLIENALKSCEKLCAENKPAEGPAKG